MVHGNMSVESAVSIFSFFTRRNLTLYIDKYPSISGWFGVDVVLVALNKILSENLQAHWETIANNYRFSYYSIGYRNLRRGQCVRFVRFKECLVTGIGVFFIMARSRMLTFTWLNPDDVILWRPVLKMVRSPPLLYRKSREPEIRAISRSTKRTKPFSR